MIKTKYGELIFSEDEIISSLMSQKNKSEYAFITDEDINCDEINAYVGRQIVSKYVTIDKSIEEFDTERQQEWFMPQLYKDIDIAAYVLDLCDNQAELQRCGEELLLFQDRNMFVLLQYLHYLVDVMTANNIIWGVGRGSSVASFVLYKLKVHRINSLYYDLPIEEFLR